MPITCTRFQPLSTGGLRSVQSLFTQALVDEFLREMEYLYEVAHKRATPRKKKWKNRSELAKKLFDWYKVAAAIGAAAGGPLVGGTVIAGMGIGVIVVDLISALTGMSEGSQRNRADRAAVYYEAADRLKLEALVQYAAIQAARMCEYYLSMELNPNVDAVRLAKSIARRMITAIIEGKSEDGRPTISVVDLLDGVFKGKDSVEFVSRNDSDKQFTTETICTGSPLLDPAGLMICDQAKLETHGDNEPYGLLVLSTNPGLFDRLRAVRKGNDYQYTAYELPDRSSLSGYQPAHYLVTVADIQQYLVNETPKIRPSHQYFIREYDLRLMADGEPELEARTLFLSYSADEEVITYRVISPQAQALTATIGLVELPTDAQTRLRDATDVNLAVFEQIKDPLLTITANRGHTQCSVVHCRRPFDEYMRARGIGEGLSRNPIIGDLVCYEDLSGLNLNHCDFSYVDLSNATLPSEIKQSCFDHAKLCYTNLSLVENARYTRFRQANLVLARIENADLSRVDISSASMLCANIHTANFSDSVRDNVDWRGVVFDHITFADGSEVNEMIRQQLREQQVAIQTQIDAIRAEFVQRIEQVYADIEAWLDADIPEDLLEQLETHTQTMSDNQHKIARLTSQLEDLRKQGQNEQAGNHLIELKAEIEQVSTYMEDQIATLHKCIAELTEDKDFVPHIHKHIQSLVDSTQIQFNELSQTSQALITSLAEVRTHVAQVDRQIGQLHQGVGANKTDIDENKRRIAEVAAAVTMKQVHQAWRVPQFNVPPTAGFQGFELLLAQLPEFLHESTACAVVDTPSIGHNVACYYAHQQRRVYDVIYYFDNDSPILLENQWFQFAESMGIDTRYHKLEDVLSQIYKRLKLQRCLLIIDHIDDPSVLRQYLSFQYMPQLHLLISSTTKHWDADDIKQLDLKQWGSPSLVVPIKTNPSDEAAESIQQQLTRRLHQMPEALEMACCWIMATTAGGMKGPVLTDKHEITPAHYQHFLREYRKEEGLLYEELRDLPFQPYDDQGVMFILLKLSLPQLLHAHPQGYEFLQRLAYLPNNLISDETLTVYHLWEEDTMKGCIAALIDSGLLMRHSVTHDESNPSYYLPKFLQEILQCHLLGHVDEIRGWCIISAADAARQQAAILSQLLIHFSQQAVRAQETTEFNLDDPASWRYIHQHTSLLMGLVHYGFQHQKILAQEAQLALSALSLNVLQYQCYIRQDYRAIQPDLIQLIALQQRLNQITPEPLPQKALAIATKLQGIMLSELGADQSRVQTVLERALEFMPAEEDSPANSRMRIEILHELALCCYREPVEDEWLSKGSDYCLQLLGLLNQCDSKLVKAVVQNTIGVIAFATENYEQALTHLQQAHDNITDITEDAELYEKLQNHPYLATLKVNLAKAKLKCLSTTSTINERAARMTETMSIKAELLDQAKDILQANGLTNSSDYQTILDYEAAWPSIVAGDSSSTDAHSNLKPLHLAPSLDVKIIRICKEVESTLARLKAQLAEVPNPNVKWVGITNQLAEQYEHFSGIHQALTAELASLRRPTPALPPMGITTDLTDNESKKGPTSSRSLLDRM